jgi:hypothetical protein
MLTDEAYDYRPAGGFPRMLEFSPKSGEIEPASP